MATSSIYAEVQQIEDFINDDPHRPKVDGYNTKLGTEDVYQTLMKKEDKVLDVINNITDYKRTKEQEGLLFINMPLHRLLRKMMDTTIDLFHSLKYKKTVKEVANEFFKKDRSIYIGLLIIIVAIFILLLTF
jgi:uncharacterized protein YjhX (UPF0386 family)